MTRQHLMFACEGSTLVATVDPGRETNALLLVSGGNEVRAGAWNGQAQLAARIAAAGFPVMRFDRRGIGDSEGGNGGFRSAAPDITAALAAFKDACPHVSRVFGLGNCDAASALMLAHGAALDGLLLCNPWTFEDDCAPPPPEVVRDHYRRRLADPRALARLLSGKVSLRGLLGSLRDALRKPDPPSTLAQDMATGIAKFAGPIRLIIAGRDRTAQAFLTTWDRADPHLRICPAATHSFVEAEARIWLEQQILDVLRS